MLIESQRNVALAENSQNQKKNQQKKYVCLFVCHVLIQEQASKDVRVFFKEEEIFKYFGKK
jgi:hypothetical protein